MQGKRDNGREEERQEKASLEIQWSLGSGHLNSTLHSFGSSMILRADKSTENPPPPAPVEKYTFQYLCNNLARISLLHLCK